LNEDFKSPALHDVGMEDLLFVHAPSGIWAGYNDIETGLQDFGAFSATIASLQCPDPNGGYLMSSGTLYTNNMISSTSLFFNVTDHDGGACGHGTPHHSWGPTWNTHSELSNAPRNFDDPGNSGALGPNNYWPSIEGTNNYSPNHPFQGNPVGFGYALDLNTGIVGAAENYMQVFVRRLYIDADGDGVYASEDCDDNDSLVWNYNSGHSENCYGVSCKQILDDGYSLGDGLYWINPNGNNTFDVQCDMTTDGGGWTGIDFNQANTYLNGQLIPIDSAPTAGIDSNHGPYTRDELGKHSYRYKFMFLPTWIEFYFGNDYRLASNACSSCTSDTWECFYQTDWSIEYGDEISDCDVSSGDVSFGDSDSTGPIASLSQENIVTTQYTGNTVFPWPAENSIYINPLQATYFQMAWSETGGDFEGWYPWYSGKIFMR
jgi:hypothetical protein